MKIHVHLEPFHHIIIDNFLYEYSLKSVFNEIIRLQSNLVDPTGTNVAVVDGKARKRGKGIFVDALYNNRSMSSILNCFDNLYTQSVFDAAKEAGFLFKYYYHKTTHDWTLLQSYGDGDYYDAHQDNCLFTAITVLYKEPKQYEGGVLFFPDHNYEVDLINNQLIIFPSRIPHGVTKVTKQLNEYETNRFTITKFMHHKTIPN